MRARACLMTLSSSVDRVASVLRCSSTASSTIFSSPIARALIGKEEGDVAEVQAPGGVRRYEIVSVSYL